MWHFSRNIPLKVETPLLIRTFLCKGKCENATEKEHIAGKEKGECKKPLLFHLPSHLWTLMSTFGFMKHS